MKKSATLLFALGLASCAVPKATIVAEAPVKPASEKSSTPKTELSGLPSNQAKPNLDPIRRSGLRIPNNIFELPEDEQLRSAAGTQTEGKATVIARPPED